MKKIILILAGAFFGLSSLTPSHAQNLLIEDVAIVSPELDGPSFHQNVLIKDGRIMQIRGTAIVADGAVPRVNASGKFLTPGLMDSHVHVTNLPGIGFSISSLAKSLPELVREYKKQLPRSLLYYGVTQVLDPSPFGDVKSFTSAPQHPDFYRCEQIPNLGGYPLLEEGTDISLTPYFIIEQDYAGELPQGAMPADHTPEAVVERIAETGSKCIKVYLEDGFGAANDWPILKLETLKRLSVAAKTKGLQIIAHANAIDMFQLGLEAGVDVFAHGLWNWQWPEDKGAPPVEDTLHRVFASKTGYMPTFNVMRGLRDMFDPDAFNIEAAKAVTPVSMLEWYKTPQAQYFRQELRQGFPADMPDLEIRTVFNYGVLRSQRATQYLSGLGHPVLLASDFPASPAYVSHPGLSTYQELETLAEIGVSLQKILEAGTINGAQQFGLDHDYGTVSVGKKANLLLLNQNPLQSVKAWDSIDMIILHGRLIERNSLKTSPKPIK